MSTGSREHHDLAPRQVYEAFLDRLKRGEKPDFADLCARYPTIAEELRELHGGQETVGQLPSSLALPASNAAAALPALPPAGRYADRRRLARGGMGVVYSVWDKLLHRQLAMKVIRQQDPPPTAAPLNAPAADGTPTDARLLARFVREAEITARLDHPGVVPIHDLGVDANGRMFFTMRLVQGKSLASVLHEARHDHQAWPQTRVIDLIVKVCETVAYAHSRRVIHRDLKPDNIMVGAFGETYVMDWGLAKLRPPPGSAAAVEAPAAAADDTIRLSQPGDPSSGRASNGSAEETEMGCVLGTAFYMPPEQAAGRIDKLDERSDIYSVGAILYELLCGQRPYAESGRSMTFDEVVDAVLVGPPRSIAEVNPRVPSELAAICEKAMARAQPQRYQGMLEMADDLRAYLENRVVRAYQTGAWAELKKWVKRNRGLAVASALVLVVSLSGLLGVVGVQSWANARLTKANDDILAANHKIRDESNQKAAALEQKTAALQTAENERRRAEGLYLARQAADVVAKNPAQALLLALESHDRRPGFEANSALLAALAEHHELRTLYGHQRAVRGLSLSPDRKRLVTRSDDETAIVWDLAGGKPTAWLIGHAERIAHVKFSPDGQWVVTAGYDNTAVLWDSTTGRRLRVFRGHTKPLQQATFSPDGRTLATASVDGTARLWDTETGAVRHVLRGHGADVYYVAFSPDGARVVSTSADRTARLWNTSTGAQEYVLQGHVGGVAMAVFTPDGERLVTAAGAAAIEKTPHKKRRQEPSSDTCVLVWNLQTGQIEHKLEHRSVVQSLALGSQSGRIAAGCADGSVWIWNLASGQAEHQFQRAGSIATLSFSLDERLVAAGNDRGEVWLVDAARGELAGTRRGHTDEVVAVAFASAAELVTASRDRSVRVWSTHPAYECAPSAAGQSGGAVLASPDGSRFLIGHGDSPTRRTEQGVTAPAPLRLCGLPDANVIAELPNDDLVGAAIFNPEGSLVATVSRSGKVRVWSARDGSLLVEPRETHASQAAFRDSRRLVLLDRAARTISTWSLPEGTLAKRLSFNDWESAEMSADGQCALAWSTGNSQAELWNVDRGERIAMLSVLLRTADDDMTSVFSPDGTVLVTSATRHPPPLLWDTATGKLIAEITASKDGTSESILFGNGGTALLTISWYSAARMFDARTGAPTAVLSGFEPTSRLAFLAPGGDRVVITSRDGHSRLWDAHSGRMLVLMGDHDEAVQKAVFSHDGRLLLALNRNGDRAVLWDARQGERLAAVAGGGALITDMDFGPDGRCFITAFADGSARVWPVAPAISAARHVCRTLTPDERDLFRVGGAVARHEHRVTWERNRLVDALLLAASMRFDGTDQEHLVRLALDDRMSGFLEQLRGRAPQDRVAELTKIEKTVDLEGGLLPIIRVTLAEAYRNHGAPRLAEQLLRVDSGTVSTD